MRRLHAVLIAILIALSLVSCASTPTASQIEHAEKVKNAKIAERKKKSKLYLDDVIDVTDVWWSKPGSIGRINGNITFKNISDKVVKYANFGVKAYNKVGDPIVDVLTMKEKQYLQIVGPIKSGDSSPKHGYFSLWKSYQEVSRMEVFFVMIEYMDGTYAFAFLNDDGTYRVLKEETEIPKEVTEAQEELKNTPLN